MASAEDHLEPATCRPWQDLEESDDEETKGDSDEKAGARPQPFEYSAFDASKYEIRLLKLCTSGPDDDVRCELITADLRNPVEYDTLSYTWGTSDETFTITLDGHPFEVTRNLYIALWHLKKQRVEVEDAAGWKFDSLRPVAAERVLWIDAICIDQKDVDEQTTQVQMMWHIYSKAVSVLVWLGEEYDDSDIGMEMVRLLKSWYIRRIERQIATLPDKEEAVHAQSHDGLSLDGLRVSSESENSNHLMTVLVDYTGPLNQLLPKPETSSEVQCNQQEQSSSEATSIEQNEGHKPDEEGKRSLNMFWISSRPHWTEDVRLNPDNQSGSITEPVSNCPQAPGPNMVWAQPTDDKGKASGLKGLDKDGKEHELEILDKEEQSQIPLMILLILHNLSSAGEPDPEDPVEWVAFQRLMERPWWRRVWIIQEVAAASNSIWVGCGAKWLAWEAFVIAALTVMDWKDSPYLQRMSRLGKGASSILRMSQMASRSKDGRTDSWGGFLNVLFETRSYLATDPRDKIFALLGFAPATRIVPNYRKTVHEVYENLIRTSISSTRCLMMLLLNRHPKRLDLPSWVPDFSLELPDDAYNISCPMGFFGADGNNWHNLGTPSTGCSLDPADKPGRLSVSGFQYDTVFALGNVWDGTLEERQSGFFTIIAEYVEIFHTADAARSPNLIGTQRDEAFWRTLIWNANSKDQYPAPEEFGKYFRKLMDSKHYLIVDPSKHDMEKHQRVISRGEELPYYEAFLRHGFGRRFFVTSRGHLASGPSNMQADDLVCILLGSKTPTILRKAQEDSCFELVGHAYVHGIMHGEALGSVPSTRHDDGSKSLGFEIFHLV